MNAYLLGLLAGDGARFLGKNGGYMVWIDQQVRNIKILEKAKNILESLGFNVFFYPVPDNKKRVAVYSKNLFLDFEKMMGNLKEFFESLNQEDKKEFVSGFLDAEGTVTDRVVIYNSNLELLESVKKFLENLGIVCYIYRFGKIFGIQTYQRKSINVLKTEIKSSIKLTRLSG